MIPMSVNEMVANARTRMKGRSREELESQAA